MEIQRTITIVIQADRDLERTLLAFREIQQRLSEPCFGEGTPLHALGLQRLCYHEVKGVLNAQMTISAIRLVAGAYRSATSHKKPATRPFCCKKARALFLIGKRGCDADFRADGTLSIWTVAGRKHLTYALPEDFRVPFASAKELDSLTVIERNGKLIGRVTLTLEVPEPQGVSPLGIDLNETNALVAVDHDGNSRFISGKSVKVKNRRTAKTRVRLQSTHATRKAEKQDTRACLAPPPLAVATRFDARVRHEQGAGIRLARRKGRPPLHQQALLALWVARGAQASLLYVPSLWLLQSRRCECGHQYSQQIYSLAGEWAAVNQP